MANNLRVFNTNSEYQSADLVHPAVSYVIETDKVHYEPTTPTPSFKWKATYQDSHVESAQCGSSSEIAYREIEGTGLTSVEIGNCTTSIGGRAFYQYSGLTSVTIPNSVTNIATDAFKYCSGLTSIDIPSGVTSIGDSAFYFCTSLTSVTVNAVTPPTLAYKNVFNNTNNCPIYVPSASVFAYKFSPNWSFYMSRIQPIP